MPLAGSKHWKILMNGSAFSSTALSFYASRKALEKKKTLHRWQGFNTSARAQLLLSSAYKHPDVYSTEIRLPFEIQRSQVQNPPQICPTASAEQNVGAPNDRQPSLTPPRRTS